MTADRNAERTTAPITEEFYREVILPYMTDKISEELSAVLPEGVRFVFDVDWKEEPGHEH